jgi:hypothetical protein
MKWINAIIMGIGSGIMVNFNLPILGACITLVGIALFLARLLYISKKA